MKEELKTESDVNYEKKKYFDWVHGKSVNLDPSIPKCSVCYRRTNDLVIKTKGLRDYLICNNHERS
jgi:hypothetical protein